MTSTACNPHTTRFTADCRQNSENQKIAETPYTQGLQLSTGFRLKPTEDKR